MKFVAPVEQYQLRNGSVVAGYGCYYRRQGTLESGRVSFGRDEAEIITYYQKNASRVDDILVWGPVDQGCGGVDVILRLQGPLTQIQSRLLGCPQ